MRLNPAHALLSIVFLCEPTSAWGVDPALRISQYGHTAWRVQDGAFGGAPHTLAQTSDGYLWIGTSNGLVRFDGVRFLPWMPPPGKKLPSPVVARLLAARDGSLWIGTTKGLSHWIGNELIEYSSGPSAVYAPTVEEENGTISVLRAGTADGTGPLCQVNGASMRCYAAPDGIPAEPYSSLARDEAGNVWLGGSTGLTRWRPGSFQTYYPRGLKGNVGAPGVCAIVALPDGSLWVGVGGPGPDLGLQRFSQGAWRPFVVPGFDSSTLAVLNLFVDRQDALWIGTIGKGVYRIHGRDVDHFDSSQGLSGDTIYTFFEDGEGNLWVGTDKGLDCFRDLKITTFSTRQGLTARQVSTVQAMRDGSIWIGGAYGLDIFETVLSRSPVRSLREGKGLPGTQVTSLFEDHAGQHWVGIDGTLNIYENRSFTRITRRDGSDVGMVYAITEDRENNLWISSYGPPRRLIRIVNRAVREELPAPETPAASSLVADPRGGIWLGLLNGDLARYHAGRMETFPFEHTPDSKVNQVMLSSDGAVLGATAFGLIGWRNGAQRLMTARDGLPCDGVNAVVQDASGDLWLHMQCGLVEITSTDLQRWWVQPDVRLQPKVLDVFDGLQLGMPPPFEGKAVKSGNGRLWFANFSVAQTIDPLHTVHNMVAPMVHVEQVTADHKSYRLGGEIRLPARTRDLEIDYTAPSFAAPQKVRFRYRLEGRDSDWQDAGARRQAFYTDLHPGTYRFRVIACNEDGVWNEKGASLGFSVAPAIYQTTWFMVLSVTAVALGLYLLYLWRLRQVTASVLVRMQERLTERERIARDLHDTLLQSVQGLILKVQSVANGLGASEPARISLERTLDHADRIVAEGRARLRDLRDSTLAIHDLPTALRRVAEESAMEPGVSFETAVQGEPRPLHPMVLEEVFWIGREAVINALSHSCGTHIEVGLHYGPRQFSMQVRDDGLGIDGVVLEEGRREGHWGLQGMRERAQRIGARLDLRRRPEGGTEVELLVPGATAYRSSRTARPWFRALRNR